MTGDRRLLFVALMMFGLSLLSAASALIDLRERVETLEVDAESSWEAQRDLTVRCDKVSEEAVDALAACQNALVQCDRLLTDSEGPHE